MTGFVCLAHAAPAHLLFNVIATGAPGKASISLCLNGQEAISCQRFDVSTLTLQISPTIPNHVYPVAGIKVHASEHTLASAMDCVPNGNGYCLTMSAPYLNSYEAAKCKQLRWLCRKNNFATKPSCIQCYLYPTPGVKTGA